MQELLIFGALTLAFFWIFQRWHDRHTILLATKFPIPKIHLLTGFGYLLSNKGTIKTFYDTLQKYGKTCLCYLGPFPVLLTSDPVIVKDILTSKLCISKPSMIYGRLTNAIGRGLITLSEPKWSNDRKILNTAFNNKNLMSFLPLFNRAIVDLLKKVDKDIESGGKPQLHVYFREFTLSIATQTTIGRVLEKTNCNGKEMADNMAISLEYVSDMTFNNFYVFAPIRYLVQKTIFKKSIIDITQVKKMIAESFRVLTTKIGMDGSFVSDINTAMDYIHSGVLQNKIKSKDVVEALFHIFIGAFETTSTTLYYMLLMLGIHPEYQERAYEEICSIFPNEDDENFEVTYEHINQMVYLDMIMNETFRLLPIVPLVARIVQGGNLTLSDGSVLPDGQRLYIDIYSIHRNKEIWGPEAEQFNPDNFLPDNVEARHPFAFIPFTKGVRFCIGWRYGQLSVKAAMAKLIKRYKFSSTAKMEDLQLENHITSQLASHPDLNVQRRRKPN